MGSIQGREVMRRRVLVAIACNTLQILSVLTRMNGELQ